MHKRLLAPGLLMAGIIGLSACSSLPGGDGITDLTLNINMASDANPDDTGRGSPVYLSVFELRDSNGFEDADYLDLYRDANMTLGGALIDTTEIGPLFPASTRTETLRLNTATTAVGVMGGFHRYDGVRTMVTIAPEPGEDLTINIRIDAGGLLVSPES